jgi:diguanylate cyclase (GGDEF)-like protein
VLGPLFANGLGVNLDSNRRTDPAALDVLVVDDDVASCESLARAIRLLGYRCRTAPDGETAWKLIQTQSPDVLLTDWKMPNGNGIELCKRVRAAEGRPYVYVVLVTSFDDKPHFLSAMSAGADEYLVKPIDVEELIARLRAASRLLSVNRVLRRESEHAKVDARVDALTGLANRRAMDEALASASAIARRYGHPLALAMADIDNFKSYNDQRGHLAGDDALRTVAAAIERSLRDGDSVYRYGGEEFLLLLPNQNEEGAKVAAERARLAVAAATPASAPDARLTVSIGVAAFDERDTAATCLARADAALGLAKARGKNRVTAQRRT